MPPSPPTPTHTRTRATRARARQATVLGLKAIMAYEAALSQSAGPNLVSLDVDGVTVATQALPPGPSRNAAARAEAARRGHGGRRRGAGD